MASLNKHKKDQTKTHAGGKATPATHTTSIQKLRRSVMSCMLWEKEFYEDGKTIADRITNLAKEVPSPILANMAIEARTEQNLRHVSLLLLCTLIPRGGAIVSKTIVQVVNRADEITELVSMYWRDGKKPLSKQMKIGLSACFNKFNEYQLAKYNRKKEIKLKDVMRLVHPTAKDDSHNDMFKRLLNDALVTPDTWETNLSAGKDKKETFTRLLKEEKLGYLAVLRNLRNMTEAGVTKKLVTEAILARKGAQNVLPFRFIAAARACPTQEPALDRALLASIEEAPKFEGSTVVLVDVSGSMMSALSAKSDLTRLDAACALASIIQGDAINVFSFSNQLVQVPHRLGMAGIDSLMESQMHAATDLTSAMNVINANFEYDRIIVITDEQTTSFRRTPNPKCGNAYMINVASCQNGIGYAKWKHINGFSEKIFDWIHALEGEQSPPKRKRIAK